jgi:hypothetical protein
MAQPLSTQNMVPLARPSAGARTAFVWGGTAIGAVVLLGTLALWYHYGTTVFFEMIAAGVSACF